MFNAARTRVEANGADLDRRIAAAEREKFKWDRECALLSRALQAREVGGIVLGAEFTVPQLQRELDHAIHMSVRTAGIAADLRRDRDTK